MKVRDEAFPWAYEQVDRECRAARRGIVERERQCAIEFGRR